MKKNAQRIIVKVNRNVPSEELLHLVKQYQEHNEEQGEVDSMSLKMLFSDIAPTSSEELSEKDQLNHTRNMSMDMKGDPVPSAREMPRENKKFEEGNTYVLQIPATFNAEALVEYLGKVDAVIYAQKDQQDKGLW